MIRINVAPILAIHGIDWGNMVIAQSDKATLTDMIALHSYKKTTWQETTEKLVDKLATMNMSNANKELLLLAVHFYLMTRFPMDALILK